MLDALHAKVRDAVRDLDVPVRKLGPDDAVEPSRGPATAVQATAQQREARPHARRFRGGALRQRLALSWDPDFATTVGHSSGTVDRLDRSVREIG